MNWFILNPKSLHTQFNFTWETPRLGFTVINGQFTILTILSIDAEKKYYLRPFAFPINPMSTRYDYQDS